MSTFTHPSYHAHIYQPRPGGNDLDLSLTKTWYDLSHKGTEVLQLVRIAMPRPLDEERGIVVAALRRLADELEAGVEGTRL